MKGRGVIAAGNWIVDYNKRIDHWPEPQTLALVEDVVTTNGGAAFNLACDITRLAPAIPLKGIGLLGNDDAGQFVRKTCAGLGVKTDGLGTTQEAATSFTDVMTERVSGRRTFFHGLGATALLDESHFALEPDAADIFFLGYLGLLPALDQVDRLGDNGSARVLRRASECGMLTAADLVSAPNEHLAAQVAPCLPALDVLFTNEWEASRLLGHKDLAADQFSFAHAADLACQVAELGVRGRVVLHFAGGAVCADSTGLICAQGAVRVPSEHIAGTTGAGDAFAAGFLVGLLEKMKIPSALELAVCSAAVSLREMTCSDALCPWDECLTYGREHGFRPTNL